MLRSHPPLPERAPRGPRHSCRHTTQFSRTKRDGSLSLACSLRFRTDSDSLSRRRDSRSVSKDPFCNGSVPVCQRPPPSTLEENGPHRSAGLWGCELAPAITPASAAPGTRPLLQGTASVAAETLSKESLSACQHHFLFRGVRCMTHRACRSRYAAPLSGRGFRRGAGSCFKILLSVCQHLPVNVSLLLWRDKVTDRTEP